MLNLQLFIEGQEVDLFQDESVTLTQTIQDVKDIEKVFTDFSRSFNVPASKTNNKIFKHFYDYHIIGFDARKKKEAQLFLNYKLFKKGKIKLDGASRKDNKAHTYKLTFFGNGINLKDLLGEDKLDALSMLKDEAFKFTYSDANIQAYMKNGLDISLPEITFTDAILFPLITHTKRLVYDSTSGSAYDNTATQNNIAYEAGSTHGLQLSQLKPALRIYPIIKAIEKQYNIIFSTDFFNIANAPFYNLYLWLHNKTGGLFEDEGNVSPVGNFDTTNGYQNGRTIDLSSNQFIVPAASLSGVRASRLEYTLDVTIFPSVADEFNFIIKKDGLVFERYDNIARDTTTLAYKEIRGLSLDNGTYTFEIESDTPSTYNFNFYVERRAAEMFWNATAEVLTDVQFRPANQLPDIKVLDFLTSLFKMFNLTSFQNDAGIIEIKTLDSFYASSTITHDITKHLDKTESSVDSVLPYKQVNLRYEGHDNFFAKNHQELFNQEWGTLQYRASDKFEGQSYTITIPLEHFKYERLKDINGNSFIDLLWGWSTDIKQEPNLGKPLLFYPVQQNEQIGIIESDGDLVPHTGVFIPSNSLELTDSNNLNFNSEFNEYGLVPYSKTLFDQYYKNYVKEIFDPQRRLTSTSAYLPLSMLMNLSLADDIRIFDNLYRINKITTNFETTKSQLELINIKEDAGAAIEVNIIVPDRFIPANTCITVDTLIYNVDTTTITADATCLFDGIDITSTNEAIPDSYFPHNDPIQTQVGVPVSVSPALLKPATPKASTSTSVYLAHGFERLGFISNTPNVDEYGFLYTTNSNDFNSTLNIDQLKAKATITDVSFRTSSVNRHTNPDIINYQVTGLGSGASIYYKFYARTNITSNYAFADTISELKSSKAL